MELDEFNRHFPTLYHMAERNSWRSILRHGLLSTEALLDLFEVRGQLREKLLFERRPESVRVDHPEHGSAVIRDQIPLRVGPLAECLIDMSIRDWLALLNRRVYLWPTLDRLRRFMSARAYRDREHDVLYFSTAALLERGVKGVYLAAINTGSTIYSPRPRGVETFHRIADYPFEERRKLRGVQNAVAEVAIDREIPAVAEVLTRVERRTQDTVTSVLWSSTG